MRYARLIRSLVFILTSLSIAATADAQSAPVLLSQGTPVERTISRGETHSFSVRLEQNDLLKLVVEQRGIDVVVRLFSPAGQSLGEYDSPNGASGPENVSLIADVSGIYRINVVPLQQEVNTLSGKYEIRIQEQRAATKEELESVKAHEGLKAKGHALLNEITENLQLIRLPETRAKLQIQVAQLLWDSDEKRARQLADSATAEIREYLAGIDQSDQNYYQLYSSARQLREEVFSVLAARDPELALNFLVSTRILVDPNAGPDSGQYNQERQLELSLANQIAVKSPRRALQLAEESLKKGYAYNLIEILNRLRANDPDSAAKLAGEIADKLKGENLLKNQEAANLLVNLLHMSARMAARERATTSTPGEEPMPGFLSEQVYRELFDKALSAALSYTPQPTNYYTAERGAANVLITSLKSMTAQMQKYAPEKAAVIEQKSAELNAPQDPQSRLWQKYQAAINGGALDAALEEAKRAPNAMKDQLYQQIAQKAFETGDLARARQILTDNVRNPLQRQQALRNLDQQAVYRSLNNDKLDEALRGVGNLSSPKDRVAMLLQIVNRFAGSQKGAVMLELLDQARVLIGGTGRAENQEQMNMLFELSRAYSRFDPRRSFEILEPLVEQINEMTEAAVLLNGFGQQYLRDGELLMQNGNAVGGVASQLIQTLGNLTAADFERAKALADRMQRPEVRLVAYLAIAQNAINPTANQTGDGILIYTRAPVIISRL